MYGSAHMKARTETFATEQTTIRRASSVIAGLCAWRTIFKVRATAREHKRHLFIATGKVCPEAEANTVISVDVDEVMLCRIYGELTRAHYGEHWDKCEAVCAKGGCACAAIREWNGTKPSR